MVIWAGKLRVWGWFWLGMLALHAGLAKAQNTIGYPSLGICQGLANSGPGSTATTPGRWWNPQRPGTGWDLYYVGQSLLAYWYSFDSAGRPVWYMTNLVQANAGSTWSSPLKRLTWNGSATASAVVGEVALQFSAADPTRLALRWKLNGVSELQDECLQDYGRPAIRASSAASGIWYEPGFSGYAVNFSILQLPDLGYVELAQLLAYDAAGQPVWLTAQSGVTAAPPADTLPRVIAPILF